MEVAYNSMKIGENMVNNNLLKKMRRKELLEILLEQIKRIEKLEEKLTECDKELAMRKISYRDEGSLADASLKLTDIFKNADEAISIYKLNIEESLKKKEKDFQKECEEIKKKIVMEVDAKYRIKVQNIEKNYKKIVNELQKQNTKLREEVQNLKVAKEDKKDFRQVYIGKKG